MNNETKTHPSYGLISWSRTSCNPPQADLFGTSIGHSNPIRLSITHASVRRDLNRDWVYGEKVIADVEMSPDQFAEFITTPNTGNGVPCTIRYTEKEGVVKGLPIESKRQQFEKEFDQALNKIGANFQVLKDAIKDLPLSKKQKETLAHQVFEVSRIINDNIPFMQTSFNEQLDKSVVEAKAAVENFVEHAIRKAGLEAIANPSLLLMEKNNEVV